MNNIKAIKAAVASIAVAAMLLIGLPVVGVANAAGSSSESGSAADSASSSVAINPTSSTATTDANGQTANGQTAVGASSSPASTPSERTNSGKTDISSNDSNTTVSANAVGGNKGNSSSNTATKRKAAAAPAAVGDCTAVTGWATLKACIESATGDVTVSIVSPIDVPAAGTIAIPAHAITLVSKIVAGADGTTPTVLKPAAGDGTTTETDAIFTVGEGSSLTIGSDKNDQAFTYVGTEDAPIIRRLVVVNGGALTVNGGTFAHIHSAQKDYQGALILNNGGTLTVNGGTFQHISNAPGAGGYSGIINQRGKAELVVNGGKFLDNTADRGTVIFNENNVNADPSSIAVHGGTFIGNESANAAGVIMQYNPAGSLSIDSEVSKPEFSNNKTGSQGGVIHNQGGALTIKDGSFSGNTAEGGDAKTNASKDNGGGVISQSGNGHLLITGGDFSNNQTLDYGDYAGGGVLFQRSGTANIKGGTFTGNKQTFSAQCTDDNQGACRKTVSGGGAIHISGGNLTVEGKVLFSGNYSKVYGWSAGGGAIYAAASANTDRVMIRNDARGNRPQFIGNWAGIYDQQYVDGTARDGKVIKQTPMGGAGGALFLDRKPNSPESTLLLMGGVFKDNSGGYLGGAVYTEEGTTTYIAKAVATGNTAGHFGGGLWLCPSGSGKASKGGNIAMFDNTVNADIDANTANRTSFTGTTPNKGDAESTYDSTNTDGVEAGSDFAMMNPAWKNYGNRTFLLMNTWFTDRSNVAVDWYQDGIPVREASGYSDAWQVPNSSEGSSLAVTKTNGRYGDGKTTEQKINMTSDSDGDEFATTLELSKDKKSDKPIYTTGVALKSVVTGSNADEKKANALSSAAVTFTGNKSRLTGGAFGTNGNVLFSTPYTASWTKTDNNTTSPQQLAGAEWQITTTEAAVQFKDADGKVTKTENLIGGPLNEDFYPTLCATNDKGVLTAEGQTAYDAGTCWKQDTHTNGKVVRTAIVKDNTGEDSYVGFDNNPDAGGFDINNLGSGVYKVTEIKAPTGYSPSTDTYTFTVADAQAQWDNNGAQPTTTDKSIENTPLPGVSWRKIDVDQPLKTVGGSGWTITRLDNQNKPIDGETYTVTDCVNAATVKCADGKNNTTAKTLSDTNGSAGEITVQPPKAGKYKLWETTTPNGYWKPAGDVYYTFEVKDADLTGNTDVQILDKDGKVVGNGYGIPNTQPQASWSKVPVDKKDDPSALLTGSTWQVYGPLDSNGREIAGVTATRAEVKDCESEVGATDPCASHTNTKTDGKITEYADVDNVGGKLKVLGLTPPPDGQTYTYQLTEIDAPDGYVASKTVYSFTIPAEATHVLIDAPTGASLPVNHTGDANLIPNVRAVATLPLTGGTTAREWLIIGGGIAFAAAAAGFGVNEYRKRRSVMV